jgi:tetratricopeptide (TPR) repeat protein
MDVGLSLKEKIVDTPRSRQIPSEARIQFQQASELFRQGKTEDALQGFKHAVEMAPNYTAALHETGNCLQHLSRPEEASVYYSRALQEISDRLCEIGRYEESLGRYWVAISRYEEASEFCQLELTRSLKGGEELTGNNTADKKKGRPNHKELQQSS